VSVRPRFSKLILKRLRLHCPLLSCQCLRDPPQRAAAFRLPLEKLAILRFRRFEISFSQCASGQELQKWPGVGRWLRVKHVRFQTEHPLESCGITGDRGLSLLARDI